MGLHALIAGALLRVPGDPAVRASAAVVLEIRPETIAAPLPSSTLSPAAASLPRSGAASPPNAANLVGSRARSRPPLVTAVQTAVALAVAREPLADGGSRPVSRVALSATLARGSGDPATAADERSGAGAFAASGQGRGELRAATGPRLEQAVDSESFYPAEPKLLGIEGTVETILDLDDTGRVRTVRITKPGGHGFDEAAAAALQQFRFRPALSREGRPIPSRIPWRFTFVLRD